MTEAEWQRDYRKNSFWNGRGYLRLDGVESNIATISIYSDSGHRDETIVLREGQISPDLFLGGLYCSAGIKIRLEKIGPSVESALLQINGEKIWVANGDRIIDDRCRVTKLITSGGNGRISISCPGTTFEMSLNAGKVTLNIDGTIRDIAINENIKGNVYLGYIGRDSIGKDFVVLVKDDISNSDLAFSEKEISSAVELALSKNNLNSIKTEIISQYKRKLINVKDIEQKVDVALVRKGESAFGISPENIFVIQDQNNFGENPLARIYYDQSIKYYEDLFDFYPGERVAEGEIPYAEEGLFEAFTIARDFDMNEKANELLNKLIDSYPDSYLAQEAIISRNQLFRYDRANSKKVVNIGGFQYSIDLLEFKKPSKSDVSALFLINGQEIILGIGEFHSVGNTNIQLLNLNDDRVDIGYEYTDNNQNKVSRRETLILSTKSQTSVNGVSIKLAGVNLRKQARVSVLPNIYGKRTQATFPFRIGIEKRAIKLSPEKTKEVIENLKGSIDKWNDINQKLGTTIKVMKGACFATSAILTVKNLFDGSTGAAIARNRLMTAVGGWNDKCEELVNQKQYSSLQQCLLDKNDQIEKDIELFTNEIQNTNSILKDIQKEIGIKHTDVLDFQGQTDAKKVEELFKKRFDEFCKNINDDVQLPGAGNEKVSFGGVGGICSWNATTHEQRREIMAIYNLKNSPGSDVLNKYVDRELGRITLEAKNLNDAYIGRIISDENTNKYNLGVKPTDPIGDTITYGNIKILSENDINKGNVYKNYKKGDNIVRIFIPNQKQIKGNNMFTVHKDVKGKEVIVKVNEIQGNAGVFNPDSNTDVYTIDGTKLSGDARSSVLDYMSLSGLDKIKQGNLKTYQNQMVDIQNLRVKYFDRAPFKGLPSLIPFDTKEGWYVKTSYVLAGFGVPYDQSGRVSNYYICNVGPNGLIEFKKSSDDICRYYNGFNKDLSFPGMSQSESSLLVQKAQAAIDQASRQYGQKRAIINGQSFETGTSFDNIEGECTDFMSAKDCNILFNVCDPVICPSSRCDLGGRYRVDNVIQTGVVGSLSLCLPNFKEGIAVPICLTGVHAGLDGYISILNSTVACLEESLETGRNIGICDEIKSVYICDLFWRQATPFSEVLLQRSFESILGQGARGGGEYLTVQSAWDNMIGASNFFTQNYAINSVQAFYSRSLGDINSIGYGGAYSGSVGAEICKSFISTGYSGSVGGIFESLIEPDSPPQYHAWFTENILTTATIPPTSHYKVYYNIFAGKDIGAYYSVYLKGVPRTPGIFSTGFFPVENGYVARGSQVDQARDFTAVSGFQQLCININGLEECGFGQVSSSYALNYITDAYAQQQVNSQITSEKECIAGTPSLYSLIQPNIQSGIQDVITPQLYNRGIIRVCSTESPGKQVLPSGEFDRTNSSYDRWQQVGYCDDPTIKCWLDTSSVKDVVRDLGIEQQILDQVNLRALGADNLYIPEQSEAILSEGREFIDNKIPRIITKIDTQESINEKIKDIVNKLDSVASLGSNNQYRARAIYLLANLFRKIANILKSSDQRIVVDANPNANQVLSKEIGANTIENEVIKDSSETFTISEINLKNNILIRLENENLNEVSYRYISPDNWLSDDKFFDSTQDYLTGIDTIVGKLQPNGRILVYLDSGRTTISANDFNNKGGVADRIIELLRN